MQNIFSAIVYPLPIFQFLTRRMFYNFLRHLPPQNPHQYQRNMVTSWYIKLMVDAITKWNAQRRQAAPASRVPLSPRDDINSSPPSFMDSSDSSEGFNAALSSESFSSMEGPSSHSPDDETSSNNDRILRRLFLFKTDIAYDKQGWKLFRISPSR